MARHRSDAAPGPARTVAGVPDRLGPSTGPRDLPRSGAPGAPSATLTPGRPFPALPHTGGMPPAPESPAIGLPVVGVAPETNRLDLAAIALASARGGPALAGGTPAPGLPAARSASPLSGPVPVGPRAATHGAGRGTWRRFLGTRRALVGLTVAGAIAGAGVAVVGVVDAVTGTDTPTRVAPAAQDGGQDGGQQQDGGQDGQQNGTSPTAGAGDTASSGSASGY